MKETYQKEKEELLREFGSNENGLSGELAKKSLEKYGPNELTGEKTKSVFRIFLEQFTDFLVIILIVVAIISAFIGEIDSSIVILIVITMNAILGTVQTIKAEMSLNSLKKLSMPNAKVIRDGVALVISSSDVVPGDIVMLEAGDYVCADGRIIENASLKINESALTGESLSSEKDDSVITDVVELGDRINMVFSGSFVTYGRGKFLVTGTGMET